MTKRKRVFLFFIFFFAFLLITPGIILYSIGYRFDFDNQKITQTGAFYFKVFPKRAQIIINPLYKKEKKVVKTTDFFFGTAYIDDFLPKKYEIEIQKNGYYPWKKTLEVKEKQVTDAKNIVLFPKNTPLSLNQKEVSEFFISPDKTKMVLRQDHKNYWELKLFDLERKIKSHLLTSKDFSSEGAELLAVDFSPGNKTLLLKTKIQGGEIKYHLIDLESNPPELNSLDFLGKGIKEIIFNPRKKDKLFFLKKGEVFEATLTTKEISEPLLKNIFFLSVLGDNLYYLQNQKEGSFFLFKDDFSFLKKEKINKNPLTLSLAKEQSPAIYSFGEALFLQDNENLYWFNQKNKNFEIFFSADKKPKLSPDAKKLLYFSGHEIWVYYLDNEFSQPQRKKGEKVFIARFSKKIQDAFWITSHYIIFNSGDKIKIAEIDDRDGLNIIDFIEGKNGKIFWQNSLKELYILENNLLYTANIPLP